MNVPSRLFVYPILLGLLAGGGASCASSFARLPVKIRLLEDTVHLRRYPEGMSFEARAIVANRGSRTLYVVGCGPSAERDINGTWTPVFTPTCIHEMLQLAEANDSIIIPVKLFGFTASKKLPRLDRHAEPGRYRIIFYVTATPPSPSRPASSVRPIASMPFVLQN
jgi:hypothetical protein